MQLRINDSRRTTFTVILSSARTERFDNIHCSRESDWSNQYCKSAIGNSIQCNTITGGNAGSLSTKINVSQGTGQGRILAPFMYKVYVNGLLCVLTNHFYAIFTIIKGLRIPSASFADDITSLALDPSFLETSMSI